MVDEKVEDMLGSFERSLRAQGMEPAQYYQLAGASPEEIKDRVRPDATDTVKKELVLDAVVAAEGIEADEHEVMHQIEHLAEDSDRDPQEIADVMRANGSYALLQEDLARSRALDFLAENAVAVPMPEGEEEPPGADEPEAGDAAVEATVEAGTTAQRENDEREEG
jgi:trigger factor